MSSPDNRPDLRVDATEDTNRVSPISVVAEAASDAERSAQVDTVVHDSACEGASLDPVVSRLRRPRLPADNTPTEHNARKTLHREASDSMPSDIADADEGHDSDTTLYAEDSASENVRCATSPRARALRLGVRLAAVCAFVILPVVGLAIGATAGYLKWRDATSRASHIAAIEATEAARDSTIAILAYDPGTVDKNLTAARERITGSFRDDYTKLVNDVVIPGAKQKNITTLVTVPAAGAISASPTHAVVLVFINQTVAIGTDPRTDSSSAVKVTMDKINGKWLISTFDPI